MRDDIRPGGFDRSGGSGSGGTPLPNDDTTEGKHWRAYATSIRAVEQTSGYDFFSAVPSSIQDAIEVAHTP